jgi:hypothetical protein
MTTQRKGQRALPSPAAAPRREIIIKKTIATQLLGRLGASPSDAAIDGSDEPGALTIARFNAALGCKTCEVANTVLRQVLIVEHPQWATASDAELDDALQGAIARVAELRPANAAEALLAAQMIGTQQLAMTFLARAALPDQSFDGTNANVHRASRLMRLWLDQAEMMEKLKGRSGQQHVRVEHVTVAAGGQAIVGAVTSGGRGAGGKDRG